MHLPVFPCCWFVCLLVCFVADPGIFSLTFLKNWEINQVIMLDLDEKNEAYLGV